jgi:hypothetical protein
VPRSIHLIAALAFAAAVAGCGAGANGVAPGEPQSETTATAASPAPTVPAEVIQRARTIAIANTDATPIELVAAEALTPAQAQAMLTGSDDITGADRGGATYLITFRGTFIGYAVSHPYGAAPPHGRYFSVGIDPADLSVSGLAITQTREPTG